MRTALILFILTTVVQRNFHVLNLPRLLGGLHWRVRRQLGIDYVHNGVAKQLSYDQLIDVFRGVADAFDAWDEKLVGHPDEDALRQLRADRLAELTQRLDDGSTRGAPVWRGHAAVDATMKWGYERPPGQLSKIDRRGADGEAGPPAPLSEIIDDGHGEVDVTLLEEMPPTKTTRESLIMRSKRKASWPQTWSLGSAWVGRKNVRKAVYGSALHTVVRADADGPCLIEALSVTSAKAYAPSAALPVLSVLFDRRMADPALAPLIAAGTVCAIGDVTADPAYSMGAHEAWLLPLKRMGASPIFRLHRTNQEGMRARLVGKGKRRDVVMFVAGRPMCECVEFNPYADLPFPKFPFTVTELVAYQAKIATLCAFEWRPNGAARVDGSRQFLAPHKVGPDGAPGGCVHCVTAGGSVVQDRDRCCATPTRLFSEEDLALWQDAPYGLDEWYDRWNVRNRVGGSYGVLKNRAVINYGRDFHHFVGLARETLVAAFAAAAHNFHMLRSFVAPAADPFAGLPSPSPTQTVPATFAIAAAEAPARGPVGLDELGAPRDGPPPSG